MIQRDRKWPCVRMAFWAGPGAGKTTTAHALVGELKDSGYNFYHVPEYARECIDKYGQNAPAECGVMIQELFMRKQWENEQAVPAQCDGYITDGPVFLCWVYAMLYGKTGELASYIARKDTYKGFLKSISHYTHIIKIAREKPYMQDGCRIQTEEEAKRIDVQLETLLRLHGVEIIEINGSTQERVQKLKKICIDHLIVNDRNRDPIVAT